MLDTYKLDKALPERVAAYLLFSFISASLVFYGFKVQKNRNARFSIGVLCILANFTLPCKFFDLNTEPVMVLTAGTCSTWLYTFKVCIR